MNAISAWQEKARILFRHFKFCLSRAISYPLVEPDTLQLCFLFRCNLKCKMCSMHKRAKIVQGSGSTGELSYETIVDLVTQAGDMNIRQLFLLGGEPFLREDLFDIIKFANELKMKTLVSTNGTLLGDAGLIEKTIDSKLDDLIISIDGACDDTYKKIRGEGIFEKIINNTRLLNEAKKKKNVSFPNAGILCTIMNQNIEELLDIVYLARDLGVSWIGFQPVVRDNTDARLRDDTDPNWVPESRYEVLDRAIDKLLEYKNSSKNNFKFILTGLNQLKSVKQYFRGNLGRQRCYTGFNRMIISQDAKMYFCAEEPESGRISFGDIRKDKLKRLWYSPEARIFRKNIKRCARPCLLGCAQREEFSALVDGLYWSLYR